MTMKKKYFIVMIGLFIVLSIWFLNREPSIDYDNYEEMNLLSKENNRDLEKKGYDEISIRKIKHFEGNYQNHLKLLNMMENNDVESYGFKNRVINNKANKITYGDHYFTNQSNDLFSNTSIVDIVKNKNYERDAARIIVEFEWKIKPQKHVMRVTYNNYVLEDIYTLLKYENENKQDDVIYRMMEIEPYNFLDEFYINIDSSQKNNQKKYILKSGTLILDIESYYAERGIAPLNVTAQYIKNTFWGKNDIISEEIIQNAEIE